MIRQLSRPWFLAIAACAWWLGVTIYFLIAFEPHPFAPYPLVRWDHMESVYDLAPWMAVPFAGLAALGLALRLKSGRVPPSWMTWGSGAAALLWIGFAFFRAHEQAFNCALWAPPAQVGGGLDCLMPRVLTPAVPWLAAPLAAWIVLAALRVRVPARTEALRTAS